MRKFLVPNKYIKDFPGNVVYFDNMEGDTLYNVNIWRASDVADAKQEIKASFARLINKGGNLELKFDRVTLIFNGEKRTVVGLSDWDFPLFRDEVLGDGSENNSPTPFDVLGEKVGLDSLYSFLNPSSPDGPVIIGFSANNENVGVNFDNSKAYVVFSQPVSSLNNGGRRTVGPISLVEGKLAKDIIGVVCKDPNQGKRFDKNRSVVYKFFDGESGLSRGTASLLPGRLGGINTYLDYSFDEEFCLRGLSVAMVGDFEFLHNEENEKNEKERITTCSVYVHAAPHFPDLGGYWSLPSGNIKVFNDQGFLDIVNVGNGGRNRVSPVMKNSLAKTAIYDEKRKVILLNEKEPFPALEKKVVDGEHQMYFLSQDREGKVKRERMVPISEREGYSYFNQ
jgi:hypothetical protein